MKEHKGIPGEFVNKSLAEIAKRDIREAWINANILKIDSDVFLSLLNQDERVQLIAPDTLVEEAWNILEIKFI